MWNALVGPRQRRAFERPPNRDPLMIELQGNGDGHQRQRRRGNEGEASEIVTWWVPSALADGTDLASVGLSLLT